MTTTPKQKLFEFCDAFVNERMDRIHSTIDDIQVSLTSETKSSAGDKHETGRAMLQLEREKLGQQQLAEAEKMRQVLLKVPIRSTSSRIGLGSWVKTRNAEYFLAVSAGEYNVDGKSIYCISVATPIAKLLLGKCVGEFFDFNGDAIEILDIK